VEDPQNVKITLLLIKGKYNVPKYGMDKTGSAYSQMIGCVIKDTDFAKTIFVRQLVGVSAVRYDTVIHVSISSREMLSWQVYNIYDSCNSHSLIFHLRSFLIRIRFALWVRRTAILTNLSCCPSVCLQPDRLNLLRGACNDGKI